MMLFMRLLIIVVFTVSVFIIESSLVKMDDVYWANLNSCLQTRKYEGSNDFFEY